jgi:hypothetical protein
VAPPAKPKATPVKKPAKAAPAKPVATPAPKAVAPVETPAAAEPTPTDGWTKAWSFYQQARERGLSDAERLQLLEAMLRKQPGTIPSAVVDELKRLRGRVKAAQP